MGSAKDVLNDKQSVLKVFSDEKIVLDAKIKVANDTSQPKLRPMQGLLRTLRRPWLLVQALPLTLVAVTA